MIWYYFITRVSITLNFILLKLYSFRPLKAPPSEGFGEAYCTTLFAQLELAKASGFALKANPIPTI